jgi:hypothetical protein
VDVTREAGITFRHVNGASGQFRYPETMAPGCAFLDYDRDGWLDILLVNSNYWPGEAPHGSMPPTLALYHNNHNGTFTDVTKQAGLAVTMYGMGVAVGDYDNDGYDDLYITGLNGGRLFHNNGNGTFTDVTRQAGVANSGHWATSCAWVDYDNDGLLDLFIGNYVRYNPAEEVVCRTSGKRTYCGPTAYLRDHCTLYRNLGHGHFQDVTHLAGIDKATGKALGVAVWDFEGKGYPDILVTCDLTPNLLFRNQRNGTFRESASEAGIAYPRTGVARSGMGIDVADLYNDGKCSVYISNFAHETNTLFTLTAPSYFVDTSDESGLSATTALALGFGLFFFDYDNDGWKDVFVTNGHIQPDIARTEPTETYAQRPLLFHNRPGQPFEEVSGQMGVAMQALYVGRGAACGDYDNDGDLDILLTTNNGPAHLLHNEGGNRNAWLTLRLIGRKSNRDGLGAEVRVTAGGHTQRDQARSGSSYLSSSDLRLHFGLGASRQADAVEVHWPSGIVDRLTAVKSNQILEITEGQTSHLPSH